MKTKNNKRYIKRRSVVNKLIVTACLLSVVCIFFFSSCTKVVKIDLNSTNPHIVVEANITNQPGPYTVKLSSTVNYYDLNTFPPVTGATVTISDNAGNSELLHPVSDGVYQTSTMQGIPGKTYTLSITYNGKEYIANSTMQYPVPVDSVVIVLNPPGGFGGFGGGNPGNPGYRITTYFTDPAGGGNYYRLQLKSNDTTAIDQYRYRVLSDKLTDGEQMSLTYNTKLLPGDSVFVYLECIDQATYMFYSTLEAAAGEGGGFSAPPANPVNNITNSGLGYFAAYSVTEKKYIIQ